MAARATVLVLPHLARCADKAAYTSNTLDAIKALQAWYDPKSGLWHGAGWWNSANSLTVLTDWALLDKSAAANLNVADVISNTFTNAQSTVVTAEKTLSASGRITSTYTYSPALPSRRHLRQISKRGFTGFLNDFYDDEGWWALALIRSWDVTGEPKYLDMAERIFDDMRNGTDTVCGGGIWWKKDRRYKNAIANELYLSVAASLARRATDASDRAAYLTLAKDHWDWFRTSGMIDPTTNLINDGLTIVNASTCVNNGMQTWSYNQGVVLGGLVELANATGDGGYLRAASDIAKAAVAHLTSGDDDDDDDDDGKAVIHETDRCEPHCGLDGSQFKGVFVRNLHYLWAATGDAALRDTIVTNADSIWDHNRNDRNQLGIDWRGPVDAGGGPNATTHTSALDVLVAALAVAAEAH